MTAEEAIIEMHRTLHRSCEEEARELETAIRRAPAAFRPGLHRDLARTQERARRHAERLES
jgi:hypothetical protein